LARGADQQLAGLARLDVEGYGIVGELVRALQIAELDELVADEAGIAVRDDEMAFAFLDGQRGQERAVGADGEHDALGGEDVPSVRRTSLLAALTARSAKLARRGVLLRRESSWRRLGDR
jgi:hypothetical protein